MNRKLIVVGLLVVGGSLVTGYGVVSAVAYDRMTAIDQPWCASTFGANTPASFTGRTVPESDPVMDTAAYRMPTYSLVSFPSRDPGLTIRGWWVPAASADGAAAPAVVMVHGHGRCMADPEVLVPAGMLHRGGFSVLLIDLRNHGESDRDNGHYAAGVKEYRDVLGAWDWLQRVQAIPAARIGLYGVSFGGATVTIAMGQEPRVAAAWEDSGWADIGLAMSDEIANQGFPEFLKAGGLLLGRLLYGVDITSPSPLDTATTLDGRPFAIVHGAADEKIAATHADLLADAIAASGGSAEPWIVVGAKHVRAAFVATAEYETRLTAFFSAALRRA